MKSITRKSVALFLAIFMLCGLAGCLDDSANTALPTLETVFDETQALPPISEPEISVVQEAPVPDVPASEPLAPHDVNGTLEITYFDVGQGDSIYIVLPNGESILIDAGESSASINVIQFIRDNNDIGTIDYLIATHPHADHIGGMAAVINAFEVKNVWMPDITHNTKTFENLLDTIEGKKLPIQIAANGKTLFDYGNLKAEFIAPCGDGYANLNNYSAVLQLTYNDRHFLFMGDAENEAEAEILAAGHDISADVLKVAHHGSASSSTKAFIEAVAPQYAVISCGKGNSYGHPANQTLATLAEFGIDVKRTDESETIAIFCDGEKISFTTFQTEIQPRAPTTEISPAPTDKPDGAGAEQTITVFVTKTGTKYHSDGCRYLSQSKIPMDLEVARQNYDPCSACNPPK